MVRSNGPERKRTEDAPPPRGRSRPAPNQLLGPAEWSGLRCYAYAMSSSESPHKFEDRKHLTEARAKLVALVGVEKSEEIFQQAMSEASRGGEVDDDLLLSAIERAYDSAARIESLP